MVYLALVDTKIFLTTFVCLLRAHTDSLKNTQVPAHSNEGVCRYHSALIEVVCGGTPSSPSLIWVLGMAASTYTVSPID